MVINVIVKRLSEATVLLVGGWEASLPYQADFCFGWEAGKPPFHIKLTFALVGGWEASLPYQSP
ncbi:MAG: hypothetical protein K2G77_00720 [Muribaculaceae bacterium]|nr:hypothetical protein [Muribaculaceae bacterium]